MIPMEIASLVGGAASGFLMKAWAIAQENRQKQFEMFIGAIKAKDDSMDKAVQRVPNDKAGNWIRRTIVIAILFGVILAPFVLAILDKPMVVEVETPVKDWFFGLFSSGGKRVFYYINAYLLSAEMRSSLIALVAFYFGQGAAKGK